MKLSLFYFTFVLCWSLFPVPVAAVPLHPTTAEQFLKDFERGQRPDLEKFPVGTALKGHVLSPHSGQVHPIWLAVITARLKDPAATVWYSRYDYYLSNDPIRFFRWFDNFGNLYWPTSKTKDFVTSPRKSEVDGQVVQETSAFRTLSDKDGMLVLEKRTCLLKDGCKVWGLCSEPYLRPCGPFKTCTAWRNVRCEMKVAQGDLRYFAVYDYSKAEFYKPPVDLPSPELLPTPAMQ